MSWTAHDICQVSSVERREQKLEKPAPGNSIFSQCLRDSVVNEEFNKDFRLRMQEIYFVAGKDGMPSFPAMPLTGYLWGTLSRSGRRRQM